MITIIINWYKTKKAEMAVKAAFYGAIATIVNNQQEIMEFIKNVYIALKDTPIDDLKDELIGKVSELAHEQAIKEHESEKETE